MNLIRFSLIGPLRTGSSLLSRCLDDHPDLICLCESEINRALYGYFNVKLHFQRMRRHGLGPLEIVGLLDGKDQESPASYEAWHNQLIPILLKRYQMDAVQGLGDKSPDFCRTPDLANHILENHRLVYTIRDPRAVYRSIQADDTSEEDKARRWRAFFANVSFWEEHLQKENVLTVRYEDLVQEPEKELNSVFSHLGVKDSHAYRETFPRFFPERFLWSPVTDMADQGVSFASRKCDVWRQELSEETVSSLLENQDLIDVLQRFGYDQEGQVAEPLRSH